MRINMISFLIVGLFVFSSGVLFAQADDTLQTYMSGIEYADPAQEITIMEAPTPNMRGTASTSFSLDLPEGRKGLTPELSIDYDQSLGHTWLGNDWDLSSPAIVVDTRWGVPRYNKNTESETYLYKGEQLTPMAHWESEPRTSEKVFQPRVIQGFEKIVRHGNHPSNYWWEVTMTNGIQYFYGGTPNQGLIQEAVLSSGSGNIASWSLVEVRDPDDNFIRYEYRKVFDQVHSGQSKTGVSIYLKKVVYTGYGNDAGAYSVQFLDNFDLGEDRRKDADINARYGFLEVNARLLRKVKVYFFEELIRSYDIQYLSGAFSKTLVSDIIEFDRDGEEFYRHSFTYYDDVMDGAFEAKRNWTVTSDQVLGNILNPIDAFNGESSMLGSSTSSYITGGATFTVGPIGDPSSKRFSAGPSAGFASSKSEGLLSIIDLNGDGLPDKVFKENGLLYYRPNRHKINAYTFGDKQLIQGLNNFSKTNTTSILVGAEANGGVVFAGYEYNNSTITSDTYFTDYNGDGLPDVIQGGQVYFNHIVDGHPRFTTNSGATPSPIQATNEPVLTPVGDDSDAATKADMFPLHDIVRMWEAPCAGSITLDAPVRLIEDLSQEAISYDKKDGVLLSIQKNGVLLWSQRIAPNDFSTYVPELGNINVIKGDRLYFRVHSVADGAYDQVVWDQEINYLSGAPDFCDANGLPYRKYIASEDFILAAPQSLIVPHSGIINVRSTLKKPQISDDLTLQIIQIRDSVSSTIYESTIPWDEEVDSTWEIQNLNLRSQDELYFKIYASTQVDWTVVQWEPLMYYVFVDNQDLTVTDPDGEPVLTYCPGVDFTMYNQTFEKSIPFVVPDSGTLGIISSINYDQITEIFSGKARGTISVKSKNALIGKSELALSFGSNMLGVQVDKGDTIYIEFHTSWPTNAINVFLSANLNGESINIQHGDYRAIHPSDQIFGPMYRGWGGFAYDGNQLRGILPINESLLMIDTSQSNNDIDPDEIDYEDPEGLEGKFEMKNPIFNPLFIDGKNHIWLGVDNLTYITDTLMSSSRNGLDDISTPRPGKQGSGATAPARIFKSEMHSIAGGIDVGISGLTGGTAFNKTELIQDVQDMNGDRYPDILNPSGIYYSNTLGGRSATATSYTFGLHEARSFAIGGSLGGGFVTSSASNSGDTRTNTKKVNKTKGKQGNMSKKATKASESASNSAGISGDFNFDQDTVMHTFLDMNGDGLVDKIYHTGEVALNLGYGFDTPSNWNFDKIRGGESFDYGGGLGFNYAGGSIVGGVSLSRTDNYTKYMLEDLNGDDLPDFIASVDPLIVQFNTGNGFDDPVNYAPLTSAEEGSSVGESVNGAFTVCINLLGFRVCVNPNSSTGRGISRQLKQFTDIDGDGYIDFLESSNDGELIVQKSKVGRTNLLKEIRRPLHGIIALDYDIAGNTYGMPYGDWILSSISSDDGFDLDRSPVQRMKINYDQGQMDRHERAQFGFERVVVQEINAADSVLRSTEKVYLQDHYYSKGLLHKEIIKNGLDKVMNESVYYYEMLDAKSLSPVSFDQTTPDQSIFPAVVRTIDAYYDPQASTQLSHQIAYSYDQYGNVTTIIDYGDKSSSDQRITEYRYYHSDDYFIHSVVQSEVISNDQGVLRKTEFEIDPTGNVEMEKDYLADGSVAISENEYDEYGNLIKIIYPENHQGQRSFVEYTYDDTVHTYIVEETNHFGYTSSFQYDLRFGNLVRSIDQNGNRTEFVLDNRGRLIIYRDPKVVSAELPYTRSYEYYPEAKPAYSLTKHLDIEIEHDLETLQFVDGFARTIQNKKMVSLFKGAQMDDQLAFRVSGWQQYDALGRVSQLYHPTIQALNDKLQVSYTIDPVSPVEMKYDALDRVIVMRLQDGSEQRHYYDIASTPDGQTYLRHTSLDALGHKVENYTDMRGRLRATASFNKSEPIWTLHHYNALDEQVATIDHEGNISKYTLDNFGRVIARVQPNGGLTSYRYDLFGNLVEVITPNVRQTIPNDGAIRYTYDFSRLVRVDYPKNIQNTQILHYGDKEAGHNRVGRLWLIEDGTGGQELFYDQLGNETKVIRTVIINQTNIATYVMGYEYDNWNRIQQMDYPDGEIVRYHYDRGGNLIKIESDKEGHNYSLLDHVGYDKFEDIVREQFGNGATTWIEYEPERRRMSTLKCINASGAYFMNNKYKYDSQNNLLFWENSPDQTIDLGKRESYQFAYDPLYRMTESASRFEGDVSATYDVNLTYDNLYNIMSRIENMNGLSEDSEKDSETLFEYKPGQPNQLEFQNNKAYQYDPNGNRINSTSTKAFDHQQLIWDEENRLMGMSNNGLMTVYSYDANSDRVIKSSGTSRGIFLNGAPAGIINHFDNYKVYVNPFFTIEQDGFTKHYYIGSERFLSKIGAGKFINALLPSDQKITAGNLDYSQRQQLIFIALQNYYSSLGIPPGPPTLYGYYGQPEYTGKPLPQIGNLDPLITSPPQWALPIGPPDTTGPPGPPVWISGDSLTSTPGYGFRGDDVFTEVDQFYYHTDHLGNTKYVTDMVGQVRQYVAYSPFGAPIIREKNRPEEQPYLYNGKEYDEETGLIYYGARYLDAKTGNWQNIDPLAISYPGISPYAYVAQNPVNYIDPDGKKIEIHYKSGNKNKVFKFGSRNVPNNKFVKATLSSLSYVGLNSEIGAATIDKAHSIKNKIKIKKGKKATFGFPSNVIRYNPTSGLQTKKGKQTPAVGLFHELEHAVQYNTNKNQFNADDKAQLNHYDDKEERRVIRKERKVVRQLGEKGIRYDHRGQGFETTGPTTTKLSRAEKAKRKKEKLNKDMGFYRSQ